MHSFSPFEAVKASFAGLSVHFVPVFLATLPASVVIGLITAFAGLSPADVESAGPASLLALVFLLPALAFLTA